MKENMDLTRGEMITVVNRSGKELELLLRRCTADDLDQVVALQDRVVQKIASDMRAEKADPAVDDLKHFHGQDMRSAALFISDPREELEFSLKNDFCYAVFDGDLMVGFSLMISGGIGEKNLGNVLGYDEERLSKCVNFETTFVDPAYRGYGIQRMFTEVRTCEALSIGATEALTSVSPDNAKSMANLEANGFVPVKEVVIYFGLTRLIMRKDLMA
jgi:ribosomal protein S18 acetylase RimI-like enzyme